MALMNFWGTAVKRTPILILVNLRSAAMRQMITAYNYHVL
jgi:hypothetical protein